MKIRDGCKFWDVRLDVPQTLNYKQPDGSLKPYETRKHLHVCVAAFTLIDAAKAAKEEYPDATIWQINCHGRECSILIVENVRVTE